MGASNMASAGGPCPAQCCRLRREKMAAKRGAPPPGPVVAPSLARYFAATSGIKAKVRLHVPGCTCTKVLALPRVEASAGAGECDSAASSGAPADHYVVVDDVKSKRFNACRIPRPSEAATADRVAALMARWLDGSLCPSLTRYATALPAASVAQLAQESLIGDETHGSREVVMASCGLQEPLCNAAVVVMGVEEDVQAAAVRFTGGSEAAGVVACPMALVVSGDARQLSEYLRSNAVVAPGSDAGALAAPVNLGPHVQMTAMPGTIGAIDAAVRRALAVDRRGVSAGGGGGGGGGADIPLFVLLMANTSSKGVTLDIPGKLSTFCCAANLSGAGCVH